MQPKGQVQSMERTYNLLVLMILIVFIINGAVLDAAIRRFGFFLAIGACLALLLNILDRRHEI